MRCAVAFVILAILGSACTRSPEDNARAGAEARVKALLKDPESAKFGNVFLVTGPPDSYGGRRLFTCGEVNAKNSYGGYSGSARFVATHFQTKDTFDTSAAIIENLNERAATVDTKHSPLKTTVFEKVYWNQYCVDETHPATFTATPD